MIDMSKVITFVEDRHKDQKYGDAPYILHLSDVARTTKKYTNDPVCIAVAWLHDVLEDTDTTYSELVDIFGQTIASSVHALTNKPGRNREERHLKTYSFIRKDKVALMIKLCDRLSNMNASLNNKKKAKMYVKEYKTFKFALYDPIDGPNQVLWQELDKVYGELKTQCQLK